MQSAPDETVASATDPVCGMAVDPRAAVSLSHGGETYYFCCDGCRTVFGANPAKYSGATRAPRSVGSAAPAALSSAPVAADASGRAGNLPPQVAPAGAKAAALWTCPMHPEIRREGPGACPI